MRNPAKAIELPDARDLEKIAKMAEALRLKICGAYATIGKMLDAHLVVVDDADPDDNATEEPHPLALLLLDLGEMANDAESIGDIVKVVQSDLTAAAKTLKDIT